MQIPKIEPSSPRVEIEKPLLFPPRKFRAIDATVPSPIAPRLATIPLSPKQAALKAIYSSPEQSKFTGPSAHQISSQVVFSPKRDSLKGGSIFLNSQDNLPTMSNSQILASQSISKVNLSSSQLMNLLEPSTSIQQI